MKRATMVGTFAVLAATVATVDYSLRNDVEDDLGMCIGQATENNDNITVDITDIDGGGISVTLEERSEGGDKLKRASSTNFEADSFFSSKAYTSEVDIDRSGGLFIAVEGEFKEAVDAMVKCVEDIPSHQLPDWTISDLGIR